MVKRNHRPQAGTVSGSIGDDHGLVSDTHGTDSGMMKWDDEGEK